MESKPTNPKDIVGSGKLPMELVPDTLEAIASLAFGEGALKYGRFNWRIAGVRASIYRAALRRHLADWWNGEDWDPKTGVPHLASVIACAGIMVDADMCGKLTDDRPPRCRMSQFIDRLSVSWKRLRELFKDHNPRHYTVADSEIEPEETSQPQLLLKGPEPAVVDVVMATGLGIRQPIGYQRPELVEMVDERTGVTVGWVSPDYPNEQYFKVEGINGHTVWWIDSRKGRVDGEIVRGTDFSRLIAMYRAGYNTIDEWMEAEQKKSLRNLGRSEI